MDYLQDYVQVGIFKGRQDAPIYHAWMHNLFQFRRDNNFTDEGVPIILPPIAPGVKANEANVAFKTQFPDGIEIIPTPRGGFKGALHAICLSMAALAKTDLRIPVPTLEELQAIVQSPLWTQRIKGGNINNQAYLGIDQAALAAQIWAESKDMALRIGSVTAGVGIVLLPYYPLKLSAQVKDNFHPKICFIHNDNAEAIESDKVNHFQGLKPLDMDEDIS